MPRDTDIRRVEDILYRASRPQRDSLHIPKKRDWRYATGVYRHKDFEDSRGDETIWDQLDEDYMNGVFGRERRKLKGQLAMEDLELGREIEEDENGMPMTPAATPSPRKKMKTEIGSPKGRSPKKHSRTDRVALFEASEMNEDEEKTYEQTGLIVRLNDSTRVAKDIQNILERLPTSTSMVSPPLPSSASTTSSMSLDRRQIITPFERPWVDETTNFSMRQVKKSLRSPDAVVENIPTGYEWFSEAVPIDAILPPGVPISGKEILAFYPHHTRGKGVALRLFNNGYRGRDIINIQEWFRGHNSLVPGGKFADTFWSAVRLSIGRDAAGKEKIKPNGNLYTDALDPGHLATARCFVVPTFENLVAGLRYLPSGLDARGLTHCLVWYLNNRDMFTPRLELNVLHAQSLIRALRLPLKPYGNRNLDMVALEEWKQRRQYAERQVEDEKKVYNPLVLRDGSRKSQIELNASDESVTSHVAFPLRNVLTFPLLAMIAMAGEGVRMGLNQAKNRKRERKREELRAKEQKEAERKEKGDLMRTYRIPKYSREGREGVAPPPKEKKVAKACPIPLVSWETEGIAHPPERPIPKDYDDPKPAINTQDRACPSTKSKVAKPLGVPTPIKHNSGRVESTAKIPDDWELHGDIEKWNRILYTLTGDTAYRQTGQSEAVLHCIAPATWVQIRTELEKSLRELLALQQEDNNPVISETVQEPADISLVGPKESLGVGLEEKVETQKEHNVPRSTTTMQAADRLPAELTGSLGLDIGELLDVQKDNNVAITDLLQVPADRSPVDAVKPLEVGFEDSIEVQTRLEEKMEVQENAEMSVDRIPASEQTQGELEKSLAARLEKEMSEDGLVASDPVIPPQLPVRSERLARETTCPGAPEPENPRPTLTSLPPPSSDLLTRPPTAFPKRDSDETHETLLPKRPRIEQPRVGVPGAPGTTLTMQSYTWRAPGVHPPRGYQPPPAPRPPPQYPATRQIWDGENFVNIPPDYGMHRYADPRLHPGSYGMRGGRGGWGQGRGYGR